MNHERFCYEARESELVIVSGDAVVTARCDGCGAYFNPREMVEVSPGGRYNAYMGTCTAHSSSLLRQPPYHA